MKIAICDDNVLHMQNTMYFVSQHLNLIYKNENFEFIQFSNSSDLNKWISAYGNDLNILILDIALENGIDGIELAKGLNQSYPNIKVIFITAFVEKSINISDAEFVYFVYKGSNYKERLKKAVDKAINIVKQEETNFIIADNTRLIISDIECLIADKKHTCICLTNGEEKRIKASISSFNMPKSFFEIHRSCIVNMNKIKKILPKDRIVITETGKRLVVAKAKLNLFIDEYRRFMGEYII